MADYFSEKYNAIAADLMLWLGGSGADVTAKALRLLNRAQHRLWQRRLWDYLVKDSDLTLVSNVGSLPSDFGFFGYLGYDSDGDGKLDYFYYRLGRKGQGYKLRDAFTLAAGHAFTITFFDTPPYTVKAIYQKLLDDFNGTDQYSFFPGDLLLLQAEIIEAVEKGMGDPNEYQALKQEFERVVTDFEQAHQYKNNDVRLEIKDDNGAAYEGAQAYSLDGEMGNITSTHPNDYDAG